MDRDKIRIGLACFRSFLWKGAVIVALSGFGSFLFAKRIIAFLVETVRIKVYYLNLPEALLASVEIALYAGIFFAVPVLVFLVWHEFRPLFQVRPLHGYVFVLFSIALFYTGALFCCFVVLPSGIQFLLSYGSAAIMPMISVEKFVIFATAMIFAFGLTFEVPVILVGLNRLGLVKSRMLTKTRRFAVLFIVIASALITPTPDVYNMMLLAVPAYVLYEVGILLMKMNERKREAGDRSVDLTG
jgi:sec-independent protein translocase protein TatC